MQYILVILLSLTHILDAGALSSSNGGAIKDKLDKPYSDHGENDATSNAFLPFYLI
jgi:hypothetical protein